VKCRNIKTARSGAFREEPHRLAPLKAKLHLSTHGTHSMTLAAFDENSASACYQPPYKRPPLYIAFGDKYRWPHAIKHENIQP
jgi:hypothetical protein